MTPDEAINRATRGEVLPVWLLVGQERYLREEALGVIVKSALSGGLADFNVDKFTAGEADVDKVLAAMRTMPMMAKKRVVIVRGLERWDRAANASSSASQSIAPLDMIAGYAKAPCDSTCLVLVGDELDGRRKLVALAKKSGFLVDCAAVDNRKLPGWITQRALSKGHTINRDVAELIAEIAGPDLSCLDDVLERLSLYVGPNAPITEGATAAIVTRVRLADTWKLVDAVSRKDLKVIFLLFGDVYDPRDRGLPLVGAVAWSLRQLIKLREALGQGMSLDEAAVRAGIVPAFRARELASKLRSFRPRELERWLTVLEQADLALKSSRRPAEAILEEMFTHLCRLHT
ncbi:MAG: DNA polymerase III subunit delta [Polyangiaceae bacterium]|nr:DNA polymerase III subunit delta [Polyangiaceae bacterium]